jgi:hypothetical protein
MPPVAGYVEWVFGEFLICTLDLVKKFLPMFLAIFLFIVAMEYSTAKGPQLLGVLK